jgi:hypothetical protein
MTQSSSPFINSRIQSYLRFAASQQRDTERIEPFIATFNRYNDNPFLNYAIPNDNAVPSLGDVNALITAYEKRKPSESYEHGRQEIFPFAGAANCGQYANVLAPLESEIRNLRDTNGALARTKAHRSQLCKSPCYYQNE